MPRLAFPRFITQPASLLVLVISGVAFLYILPVILHPGALLFPASALGSDIAVRHWPDFSLYARMVRQGLMPLWDNSILLGRPLAGDTDALWLYPPAFIALLAPLPLAFNGLALWHIACAGATTYGYLRRALGLTRMGALAGGLTFMLWPKFTAHIAAGHVGLTGAAALVPLAMWGAHLAFFRTRLRAGLPLIALALAGQLTAHAQIFVYSVWLVIGYAAVASAQRWRADAFAFRWAQLRPGVTLGVAGVLTAGLAAASLFPALELLPYVSRQSFTLANAARFSLPPILTLNLVWPFAKQFPEWVMYPGAVPLALALMGGMGPQRRRALGAFAALGFVWLYSLGPATPVFTFFFHYVPAFNWLRVAPRLWLVAGLVWAFAAGLGVEALVEDDPHQRAARWRGLLAVTLVGGAGWLSTWVVPLVDGMVSAVEILALLALLVALRARNRLGPSGVGRFVVGLLTTSLLIIGWRFLTWVYPSDTFLRPAALFQARPPAPEGERWYAEVANFPYARAADDGIETVQAVQSFQLTFPTELINLAAGCNPQGYAASVPACLTSEIAAAPPSPTQPSARLMGLLNVRWLWASRPPAGADWKRVDGQPELYENTRFLPRAFVVGEARQVTSSQTLTQLATLDPATTALVSEPLPEALTTPQASGPVAALVWRTPQSAVIQTTRSEAGLLVISQAWAPGWRAQLDGEATRVYRVDYALLGVYLPPGAHEVMLEYNPRGWQWGWPISVMTLAGWLLAYTLFRT